MELKLLRKSAQFIKKLATSKSKNKDRNRREFILNIILLASLFWISIFTAILSFYYFKKGIAHTGMNPVVGIIALIFLIILFTLSKKGFSRLSSYILVIIYLLPTSYTALRWGVEVPQVLLTLALIIVISGVLINARFSFILALLISTTMIALGYFQYEKGNLPDSYWKNELPTITNIIEYALMLNIIAMVSWLFSREIEKSFIKALKARIALRKERDLLELNVKQRTKDLEKAQLEKMTQIKHFAEFGRSASGLFHDLVNSLTGLFLNIEALKEIKNIKHNELKEAGNSLDAIFSSTEQMRKLIEAVRKQLQKQQTYEWFSSKNEIDQAITLLSYKARKAKVALIFNSKKSNKLYGDSLKFFQLATNLISNAIDSYNHTDFVCSEKIVKIRSYRVHSKYYFYVQDFGCGIPEENLSKIFKPLFTTKSPRYGTGLGLTTCLGIIEKDFGGKIHIKSKPNKGTRFTVIISKKKYESAY